MTSEATRVAIGRIITTRSPNVRPEPCSDAEWDELVEAAELEGLSQLMYWVLAEAGRLAEIPERAAGALRSTYTAALLCNENILRELDALGRLFHQADIPAIVLKGASLAIGAYPDIGLRPMSDLDLLVPTSRLPEAVALARSRGFTHSLPEASSGLNRLLRHHETLIRQDSPSMMLEIHDSLVADKAFVYAVPVTWFWTQARPIESDSTSRFSALQTLNVEAQVLYASAHAMLQHGGKAAPLRWFYDIHLLVERHAGTMDWDLLLTQAQAFEWGSALAAAIARAQEHFDTSVPASVQARLSRLSDRHEKLVARLDQAPSTRVLDEGHKLQSLHWPGRVWLAVTLVVPSPSYMIWRYQLQSSWHLPRAYIVRWGGILKDAARTLGHAVRRG